MRLKQLLYDAHEANIQLGLNTHPLVDIPDCVTRNKGNNVCANSLKHRKEVNG